jgi:hypothetical protein
LVVVVVQGHLSFNMLLLLAVAVGETVAVAVLAVFCRVLF